MQTPPPLPHRLRRSRAGVGTSRGGAARGARWRLRHLHHPHSVLAAVRPPAPIAGCRAADSGAGGSLAASTPSSSALCGPPSGLRHRSPGVARRCAGCGAGGARRRLRHLHHPHSAGRRTASGTDRRVSGGGAARGGSPAASTPSSSALCGPPSGLRHRSPGVGRPIPAPDVLCIYSNWRPRPGRAAAGPSRD